jgi:hypothetical protein
MVALVMLASASPGGTADTSHETDRAIRVLTKPSTRRALSPEDTRLLVAGLQRAHDRGASPRELVHLAEDLRDAGVDVPGILVALDAVGRLAEEGHTDAETRRGVALGVLRRLAEGVRGQELADRTGRAERQAGPGPGRASAGPAKDKQEDRIPQDLRDDLRSNTPPGLSGDREPAGVRERKGPPKDKPGGK